MLNAKQEFLDHAVGRVLKCGKVVYDPYYGDDEGKTVTMPVGGDLAAFLEALDFEYDSGYGAQCIDGTLWWEDGSWSTREEHDGAEWWEPHYLPEIPAELQHATP